MRGARSGGRPIFLIHLKVWRGNKLIAKKERGPHLKAPPDKTSS